MNKQILRLAIPSVISNITVPLLSLADTAIVGHLGSTVFISAIAVGGMMFNMLFWLFGFLRMGTGGITAQAFGRADEEACSMTLWRGLLLAFALGFLLIALQDVVVWLAFRFMNITPAIAPHAVTYFRIGIWGAPAVLSLYVCTGWFIGMQNARLPMYIALIQNVANIAFSLVFVFGLRAELKGVAFGTLLAQYIGMILALGLLRKYFSPTNPWRAKRPLIGQRQAWRQLLSVNRDIFLRTLCLIAVNTGFTVLGSYEGEMTLAVNALLIQLFILFSYFMDGFAYAGEALAGRYYGAADAASFDLLVRRLFILGLLTALLFTLLYVLGGSVFLHILTDRAEVITAALPILPWTYLIPLVSFSAFLYDGLFIGLTASRQMLISMFVAMLSFFIIYYLLHPACRQHALWIALLVYLGSRGLWQAVLYRSLRPAQWN